ncbi:hypothetical protein Sjap_014930 [Stephania japonica]|uniref:Uncharacterized protein n=1 Tax=Stephania japonica TaxID=461633 RepID=A0AAP0IJ91_9MAGN
MGDSKSEDENFILENSMAADDNSSATSDKENSDDCIDDMEENEDRLRIPNCADTPPDQELGDSRILVDKNNNFAPIPEEKETPTIPDQNLENQLEASQICPIMTQ